MVGLRAVVAGTVLAVAIVACSGNGESTTTEKGPFTEEQCLRRGGQVLTGLSKCPGGRYEFGSLATEAGVGSCCENVPVLSVDQCEAAGGEAIGDPGGGSTYRDGCPSGQKMLGSLDFGIEGGICCK